MVYFKESKNVGECDYTQKFVPYKMYFRNKCIKHNRLTNETRKYTENN